jgi:hypothetical protein
MVRGEKPLEPSGSGGFSLFRVPSGSLPAALTRWIRWNLVLVLVLACVERLRRRR